MLKPTSRISHTHLRHALGVCALSFGLLPCALQAAHAAQAPSVMAGTSVQRLEGAGSPTLWRDDTLGLTGLSGWASSSLLLQLDTVHRYGLQEQTAQVRMDWAAPSKTAPGWTLEASAGGQAFLPRWSVAGEVHQPITGARVLNLGAGATAYQGQSVYPLRVSVDQYWHDDMYTAGVAAYVAPGLPSTSGVWVQWLRTLGDRGDLVQVQVGAGSSQETLGDGQLERSTGVYAFARYHKVLSRKWSVDLAVSHTGGLAARDGVSVLFERAF